MDARDVLYLNGQGLQSRQAADLDGADDVRKMQHIANREGSLLLLDGVGGSEILDVVTGNSELACRWCRYRHRAHVRRRGGCCLRQYLVVAKREVEWSSDIRQRHVGGDVESRRTNQAVSVDHEPFRVLVPPRNAAVRHA